MTNKSNRHNILAGDINLLGIDWETNAALTATITPKEVQKLLAILEDFGLHQSNSKLSRENTILDLFITNAAGLVNRIEVPPGLSDHDAILAEFFPSACRTQKKLDKKFKYITEWRRTNLKKISEIMQGRILT